jgi:tetratricopeptide (TPR) repeat protein
MRVFSLIALVLFVSLLAAPARAGMEQDCSQDRDADLQISGCSAIIRSGEYSGKNLAIAYSNRGHAYGNLGEYRRAIEGLDQALRLDPGLAKAYYNRGVAYRNLSEYRRAIENYDQALRLDPGFAFAYNNRGNAYDYLGDPARATTSLRSCAQPSRPTARP